MEYQLSRNLIVRRTDRNRYNVSNNCYYYLLHSCRRRNETGSLYMDDVTSSDQPFLLNIPPDVARQEVRIQPTVYRDTSLDHPLNRVVFHPGRASYPRYITQEEMEQQSPLRQLSQLSNGVRGDSLPRRLPHTQPLYIDTFFPDSLENHQAGSNDVSMTTPRGSQTSRHGSPGGCRTPIIPIPDERLYANVDVTKYQLRPNMRHQ